MIEINNLIVRLLINNDRLAIKNFGVFVKEYKETYIHPVSNTITPSRFELRFEQNQNQQDEILVNEISQIENSTKEEAEKTLNSFVENIYIDLKAGKKFTLKNIGHFVFKQGNSIVFEQDLQFNFYPESFGLKTIVAEPIKRVDITPPAPIKPIISNKKKSKKWLLYTSIAAVLVVLAGLAYWQKTMITDFISPKKVEIVAVDSNAIRESEEKRMIAEQSNMNLDSAMNAEENLDLAIENTEENGGNNASISSTHPYLVVAGCFKVEQNAKNFSNDLAAKGFPSLIVGKTSGLYRVCFGTYVSKDEANTALKDVVSKGYKGAWVQFVEN